MIFYFSATGNSRYAAQEIAAVTGERLVDIGDAYKNGQFEYDLGADTYLGFVLPTFAWTLPGIAAQFIDKLKLTGAVAAAYVFGVFTCGESSGFESAALRAALADKGIHFNGSFDLVMPDNFIIWSSLPDSTQLMRILGKAMERLCEIVGLITSKTPGTIDPNPPKEPYMKTSMLSTAAGTSKLYADDSCTRCGQCAELCPMSCIKLTDDGAPVWEGECTMCLACLHRCPAAAVQHGDDTRGKARYVCDLREGL